MLGNRLAVAALVIACLGTAGAGGYLATRYNVADVATQAASAPVETAAIPSQPVRETEATVASVAAAPAPAPEAPRSNAKRADMRGNPVASAPTPGATRESTPHVSEAAPTPERTSVAPTPATPPIAPEQVPVQQPPAPAEERSIENVAAEPQTALDELVVSAESVIGLQLDSALSSERARVEDRVEAKVVRDVRVGGAVAIPAGTRALGTVVVVERGGKFRERARLGIRFHSLTMGDGTRVPISTETIYRYGDAPGNASASRIGGGAVVGAIVGGILGGGKGAAIGATAGAGAGTASIMAGDRNAATFPAGTDVTARILSAVTITVERE